MSELDELRHDGGTPSAYDIVDEFYPYDGPRDVSFTRSAAAAMAHLVRYLNNSTQYPAAIDNAPSLGAVVDSVATSIYRFDQLLDQLADAAGRLADDPTLYDDQRPREQGGTAALDLSLDLNEVRSLLRQVRPALDRAARIGSRLGHRSEGES